MSQSQIGTGLKQIKVDVEDTSFLSSTYFLLTNFNGNFGLGKNAITINNPTKDVQVEVYDASGNVLYSERAIDIDNVNKKQTITVSFHVTSKTSSGIGKLYIIGTVANKLIRYSTNVNINTMILNTSKVAFYSTPTLEVTPLLTYVARTNLNEANPKTVTGSFFTKAGYPVVNFNVDDNKYNKAYTDYQVITTNSVFSSSFNNFYAKLYINKIRNSATGQEQLVNDTSSILIKNVINSTTLQLATPYVYKNSVNNKYAVTEIIQGTYEILYSEYDYNPIYFTTASYLTESVDFSGKIRYKKSSIAEVTYRNIDTFSGTVIRHKLYRRSLNVPDDYTTLIDETFTQNEYLKNSIIPIKSYQNLGNFYSQDFIGKFWFTSSNNFNLVANSNYYINGVNITGSSINNGYIITKLDTSDVYRNSTYIAYNEIEYLNQSGSAYDCNFIKLLKNTNYILSFNCNLIKKNAPDVMDLSFYLIGSYENNQKEKNYNQTYGVLLANLQVPDAVISKNFNNTLKFKFTPLNDLYGTLVIVPRGADSIVLNNISLQQDKVDGYNYNSYTIRVPFSVDQPNELFDIKAELYDANANLVYSNLRTIQAFDASGSSSPVNNFDTATISVGVLNVSSQTNLTGSINVDNFGCAPETDINNVNYIVTWDSINKNLCVATSSLFVSGSTGGSGLITGSTYPITSSWAQTSNIAITSSYVNSSSYATTASYIPNLTIDRIISPNTTTFVTTTDSYISSSIANVPLLLIQTQSVINIQNNSGSFGFYGRYSGSNINIGIPNDIYPWGSSLTGSYFSVWNSNTNVSDMLRFFAGAFSSSYPIPTPNTKIFSGVTNTNNNIGSIVTINGRVPNGSTNNNIIYLQPLGWATIGQTLFSGYTFYNGTSVYVSYASNTSGTTLISSSLGSNAFDLGLLTGAVVTPVYLSGSFKLTFASSSAATINYSSSNQSILTQSVENTSPTSLTPIALKIISTANPVIIPSVYQDGYFSTFTGSAITNSVSLTSVSSSGIYVFSASIGIASGSSVFKTYNSTPFAYNYTPISDSNFIQTLTSPNSSGSYTTAITRSLSGAPYMTSGSTYRYIVTGSGVFNPLYYNGTVASVSFTNATLGLTTINSSSVVMNPTIQTDGVVKDSTYTTTRVVGTYPYESDVVVFGLNLIATGTGSTVAQTGASFTTFAVSTNLYNKAGSLTSVGNQSFNVSFNAPPVSGSLLYFGRPDGYTNSSLYIGSQSLATGSNTDVFLDETYRLVLNDNMLTMTGTPFNSGSYLGTNDLQIKPGYLVNPGGVYGYWYPNGYGTTYKYYIRRFKSAVVVNQLRITVAGNTNIVRWDDTTADSIAIALLFESGNSNIYARCRLYDVANLATNLISSSVSTSDFSTSGVNPFTANIDLYGNSATGASNSGGMIIFPTRAADGAILDNTNAAQDEIYVIVRYNGSPTPLTSLTIEKLI